MGPGPSDVPPSVLNAMSQPLVGHLDPSFVQMMEEIKDMLRQVFLTGNDMTFPVSGTGSAGMEFCFVNLIEPGDEVIIGVNGVFGGRMADVATRCGAKVTQVEAEWGRIIEPAQVAEALASVENPKRTTAEDAPVDPPPTASPLSTTTVDQPALCNSSAIEAPMTPAPTTTTSGTGRILRLLTHDCAALRSDHGLRRNSQRSDGPNDHR